VASECCRKHESRRYPWLVIVRSRPGASSEYRHILRKRMSESSFPAPLTIRSFLSALGRTLAHGSLSYRFGRRLGGDRNLLSVSRRVPRRCEGRTLGFRGGRRRLARVPSFPVPLTLCIPPCLAAGGTKKPAWRSRKTAALLRKPARAGHADLELGPDFFSNAGIPDDERPFDLP